MLTYKNNHITYSYSLCQQCGICEAVCPKQAITMTMRKDGTHDIFIDQDKCILCKRCVSCCPSNKEENYGEYFEVLAEKKFFIGFSADKKVRKESSSGGVAKTLIVEGLKSGKIDGAYILKHLDNFPFAEGEFYTHDNIPEYSEIPNSVYHSVMACRNINRIQPCKHLLLVGTSCQLRAMNAALKGKAEEITRVCIFCKQQKTLDSTRFIAKLMGTKIPENLNFSTRYRGDGWPGIVRVNESELPWNRAAQIPFGRRLWTVPGCDICGDAYGINAKADISLMDPWKIRTPNDLGETLITVHSARGLNLLESIKNIKLQSKSFNEVEPALSIKDVWRKQQTIPYFRGNKCESRIQKAGIAEREQRKNIEKIVVALPKMPILFYRILCKFFPNRRNQILK